VPFSAQGQLLKHRLAAALREEILAGRLQPGDAVVETQLAPRLGVAQTSIREAINILVTEGFIEKEHGKSARVIQMTEEDVADVYRVRAVLEGLAARLAAESKAETAELEATLLAMREAIGQANLRGVIEKDLTFHLQLARLSGSRVLERQLRQVLVPLFAFTLIRATKLRAPVEAWGAGSDGHRLIVQAIRSGDPVFAEQTAIYAVREFAGVASQVWAHEVQEPEAEGSAPVDSPWRLQL
jgi:DNA-binding GntR family transcriptional regulator